MVHGLTSPEEFIMDHGLGGPANGDENIFVEGHLVWGSVSQARFHATTVLCSYDCHTTPIFQPQSGYDESLAT
ncbi:hypothetical protein TNCT_420811 [Trichonephila clavata]|uniref:Uncharacterized protein n=1 Tax=Trichonephila clavata TaxID=2740835 RepID=A0A8X6LXV4_TRICU|nr:hypothetical protein TNCT_420811 [Trichonephila clavata]